MVASAPGEARTGSHSASNERPHQRFKQVASSCFHEVLSNNDASARAALGPPLAPQESGPARGKVCAGLDRGPLGADGAWLGSDKGPSGSEPLASPAEGEEPDLSEGGPAGFEYLPSDSSDKQERPVLLDPMERVLASPHGRPAPPVAPAAPHSAGVMNQVAEQVLKRIQISGDGRSGKVRMEVRLGELEGSTVELDYDDRGGLQVHVELASEATEGTRRSLQALEARLRQRGLPLTTFDVD